jgi:hypothetical protein
MRLDHFFILTTPGAPHLLEVVFERGKRGECADLRPALPLVLRW